MATTKAQQTERDEKLAQLRADLPMGSTVYTVVRHVSSSGMMRVISAHYVNSHGDIAWIDLGAAGFALHARERGYVVKGTGMDMAFHAVYTLAHALYGNGYTLTKRDL